MGGCVLTLGQGDTGQLGLGPDVMERTKPGKVDIADPVVQISAGGMHTVCLTDKGEVIKITCCHITRANSERGLNLLQ